MTALGWYLLLILFASAATFGFVRLWSGPIGRGNPRSILLTHAAVVVLLSVGVVLWFLGWQSTGAAPAAETTPYYLEQTGFYVAEGKSLDFRSDHTESAVLLPALSQGEWIELAPTVLVEGARELHWTLRAAAWELPLRIDGKCVNLPNENWFQPGDTLLVKDTEQRRFFSVQWVTDERAGEINNLWLYNQGVLRNGRLLADLDAPAVLEDRALREGLRLSAMAGHRLAREIRRLDETAGEPAPPWWERLYYSHGGRERMRLRTGVTLGDFKNNYRRLAPLFDKVLWVRHSLGRPDTPIGVFLNGDLFNGRQVQRVSAASTRLRLTARPRRQPLMEELHAGRHLRYGFGATDSFEIELDGRRESVPGLGLLGNLQLTRPPSWRLPSPLRTELMILSREVVMPVPAIRLDVGLDREPFYAKSHYLPDKGGFEVNDGREFLGRAEGEDRPFLMPGEIFRLGGIDRGVRLRFVRQASPVRYPGLWAATFLMVGGISFAWSLGGRMTVRPRLDLAWTLLWGFGITLLVVRLILSYRIAVLPPLDSSTFEVRNVFEKSLWVTLGALAWAPLALAAVRVAAQRRYARLEWKIRAFATRAVKSAPIRSLVGYLTALAAATPRRRLVRDWLLAVPAGLSVAGVLLLAWLAAGVLFARNEAVAGVRINIVAHLLILLGVAAGADWITYHRSRLRLLFAGVWLLLPGLWVVGPAKDLGFAIHFLTFLLLTGILLVWDRQRRSRSLAAALLAVFALLILSPILVDKVLSLPLMDRLVTRIFDPGSSHVYYRLANPETLDDVLVRPTEEDAYNMTYFLRNSQQHWQMMLYAAEGARAPQGYGGAPMSRVGMTYPTSMSDCVYAVHLLAEHGAGSALLLLLVYAAIAAVFVYASAFLPDGWRSRALFFIASGAYFSLIAFYMASANLGLLVFTGQNMPLLSLHSRSDLWAGIALMAVATFLLRFQLNADRSIAFNQQPWVKGIAYGYLVFLAIAWIGLVVHVRSLAADDSLRSDFTLPREVFGVYESNLPMQGKATPLELRGVDDLYVVAPHALSWPEKQFLRAFELQSDRYDPLAGFYYLEATDDGLRVRINRSFLNLTSPFSPILRWRGAIETRGPALPTLNLLGTGVSLRPGEQTAGETIVLNEQTPPREEVSASVVLAWRRGEQRLSLCEFVTSPAGFSITPYLSDGSHGVRFEVYVDGEQIVTERNLAGNEVIRILGTTTNSGNRQRFSYSLMYLGRQAPTLAFTTWRNGRERRIVAESSLAKLAEDLGNALDTRQREPEVTIPRRVVLSVNASLHQRLERVLAQQIRTIYRDDDPPSRRQGASLAVLDLANGELLALPSLPGWRLPEVASAGYLEDRVSRVYLRNDNLRNHVIGSTIKPVLLAAVATGYWPAGFDVAQMAVKNISDCAPQIRDERARHAHCEVAGVKLESPWDCRQPPDDVIDERAFLVRSRNFYAGVLGMLGMVLDPADWRRILQPSNGEMEGTSILYRGAPFQANLTWAPPRATAFTFDDSGPPRPKASELRRSLLFHQIPLLFEVEPDLHVGDRVEYPKYLERQVGAFYPNLGEGGLADSPGIEYVVPDLISLRPGLFQSTRQDLLSFFLGGGNGGRWNNVRLAEAAARIVTGRKVVAHLGRRESETAMPEAPAMPAPLSNTAWRLSNVIEPLRMVGREGTASGFRRLVMMAEAEGFRILIKTGTLEELVPQAGSSRPRFESELLLFVIGRWHADGFVSGEALAGVLYLEDSRSFDGADGTRTTVALPLLEILLEHLRREGQASEV